MVTKEPEFITVILEKISRKSTYLLLSQQVGAQGWTLPAILSRLGIEPDPALGSIEKWFESLTASELFDTASKVLDTAAAEKSPPGEPLSQDLAGGLYRVHAADFASSEVPPDVARDPSLKDWVDLEKLAVLGLVDRSRELVDEKGSSVEELKPLLRPVCEFLVERLSFLESMLGAGEDLS